jgi:transposase
VLRLTFSEEDIKELHDQRYHHPHPRVQQKMEALLLKAKGLPHQQIASCVGICENTLRTYLKQYQTGGIEALKVLQFHHPTSELQAHRDTSEAYFQEHPAPTIPEAVKRIEDLIGLKRSPTQVGIFLKKMGLKRLKTSALPAKLTAELQASLKKTNENRGWSKPKRGPEASFSWIVLILC